MSQEQGLSGIALQVRDGQEQVFGGDVLIIEIKGFLKSLFEDRTGGRGRLCL